MSPLLPNGLQKPIVTLCLILLQSYCPAQEKSKVQFGKVTTGDFVISSSPIIDSDANAIILSDIGSVHFVGNKHSWFSHVFKRQTRIKILNKKAFDLATIRIRLYTQDENIENVDNLTASTFNLENGQVIETKLDKNDVFQEREDKNWVIKKFTMPAVKEGSIIEYTYTITSPYNFNLQDWEFQSVASPCLWSEFQVAIPQALFYIFTRQGVHTFAVDKGSEGHETYKITEKADPNVLGTTDQDLIVSANTVQHRWVMKDIPAFNNERYLSTPRNYIDKIDFQLSKTYNGSDYADVANNWKKVTEELLGREDFGLRLSDESDWLAVLADKITAGHDGMLEQARAIYYYVNSHFTCTDHYNYYIKTNLRDVVQKNSGTVGDLNLLLTALLRRKGLQADPVVLSTREYGYNLISYPVLSKLNYVIVRLKIYGQLYYLDAAHPQLGFGQLAGNCYNGHARIISNKDSGSVYFEADSLKEKKTTMVLITPTDKGLEGNYQSTMGQQESYNTREEISEKGKEGYFKGIQTSYGDDLDISNTGVDSLQRPEDPLKVYYDFTLRQTPGASLMYFNPLFMDAWRENPFKAAERKYPVEMPYAMDNVYIFSLQIPDGYVVDELPKSARVKFNEDQGLFEYILQAQDNLIQLRCHLKLSKAYFAPEDYNNLRDFFAFIVKKESEQIVLKKK
ncbi:MAG TPA: DUF3857 domain-containing protein [Puia sp.]|jgi:hypothetical protein